MVSILIYMIFYLIIFISFSLLALTQFPHRRATKTSELSQNAIFIARLLAGFLQTSILIMAVWHDGGGFGFLLWACLLSLSAFSVSLILGGRPNLLAPLARQMVLLEYSDVNVHLNGSRNR
ncbi:DUF3325 family protein [Gluconobacter kanchanaburiensis]|uniref:DUF3325 family protein n=1 Tax=Gluconobacter kanchanaburiensis TaxID=563199 RepID=UPI0011BED097|nr:DUF3325 family protein [Gluconobacter kanchanaburiensis]MBF0863064.1 DUF3325 domain-containing protein [Gluconobacter kanchanaburiensis]